MSAWIRMVPVDEATGTLAEMYAQATTPHGTVDPGAPFDITGDHSRVQHNNSGVVFAHQDSNLLAHDRLH